ARELLLAQSSDWAFIMKTQTAVKYACDRLKAHLARFRRLERELGSGQIDGGWLADLESRDNLFPQIDYRVYAHRRRKVTCGYSCGSCSHTTSRAIAVASSAISPRLK